MMKKIKYLIVSVLLVLSCLSLCSCRELDMARYTTAVFSGEETIELRDVTYKKLPSNKYIFLISQSNGYDLSSGYVTAPDVPVLLARNFGTYYVLNEEETLLCTTPYYYGNSVIIPSSYQGNFSDDNSIYCREDLYDEIKNKMQNPVIDKYLILYNVYNQQIGETTREKYLLSEAETAAINAVIQNDENLFRLNENSEENPLNYYSSFITIRPTSEDLLFTDRNIIKIYFVDEDYYIQLYTEENDSIEIYSVPQEYKDIIGTLEKYSDYPFYS